jgi:hypothetical protein
VAKIIAPSQAWSKVNKLAETLQTSDSATSTTLILTSLYQQRNNEEQAGDEEDDAAGKAQDVATSNT